jgi:esterase/lipase
MLECSLLGPEYSIFDTMKFIIGNVYSVSKLYKYLENIDYRKNNVEFIVPMYFCIGKNDYVTPFALVEEYYNLIKAPKKNLFWFEKSAHDPQLEEQDKFYDIMMKIYNETNSVGVF